MFTVKYIAENGYQHLYDAREVRFSPASANDGSEHKGKAVVQFDVIGQSGDTPGGCSVTIDSGEVYVMNASGKTVGNYVLRTKEFPHGLAPQQR